jgi:hypothetical protein
MPGLSKSIPGTAYREGGDSLGFHYGDLSVIIENRRIIMIGADSEAEANAMMEWIRERSSIDNPR